MLIKAGACDGFGHKRDVLMATIDRAVQRAREKVEQQTDHQLALFASEPEAYVRPQASWSDGDAPIGTATVPSGGAVRQIGLLGEAAPDAPEVLPDAKKK